MKKFIKNHHKKIWILQPGSSLDKGECTVQMLTQVEGKQPRIAVIFSGAGESIKKYKKVSFHPDNDVYWQSKAWADTKFSVV